MYIREWSPDPITGDWTVRQNSGWIDYRTPYPWTLSSGQGVKYVGVWLSDAAGNVSNLNEHTLMFINRMDGSQVLAAGQRVQYRGILHGARVDVRAISDDARRVTRTCISGARAMTVSARPLRRTQRSCPGRARCSATAVPALEPGRYLMDVQGVGASVYEVTMSSPVRAETVAQPRAWRRSQPRPEHPLTVSDPLSAGQVGPAVTLQTKSYLPIMFRNK